MEPVNEPGDLEKDLVEKGWMSPVDEPDTDPTPDEVVAQEEKEDDAVKQELDEIANEADDS